MFGAAAYFFGTGLIDINETLHETLDRTYKMFYNKIQTKEIESCFVKIAEKSLPTAH